MADDKNKNENKKVNIDLGNPIKKPSNNLRPTTDKEDKK